MSDKDTITIELPADVAKEYASGKRVGGCTVRRSHVCDTVDSAIKSAVAEHEKSKNPLRLPWHDVPLDEVYYRVVNCEGNFLTYPMTNEQARLIAAAPELAAALEHADDHNYLVTKTCALVFDALKKAGRR